MRGPATRSDARFRYLKLSRDGLGKAVSAGLGEKDWSITADMTVRRDDSMASSENKSEKKL